MERARVEIWSEAQSQSHFQEKAVTHQIVSDRPLSWFCESFFFARQISFAPNFKQLCLKASSAKRRTGWPQKSLFWTKCFGWMKWTVVDMIEVRSPVWLVTCRLTIPVSRIKATSPSSDLSLILDLNTEIYPLEKDELISLNLSSSLRLDGKEDKGWRDLGKSEPTLADDYDYVCYGKVYRFDESVKDSSDRVYVPYFLLWPLADGRSVYISFGGLLMNLEGSYRKLSKLAQDNIYLLIRK